jgi:GntR family transcriptional regulator
MSLIIIDKQSRVPVYEQIKNQIITFIRIGVYPAHSKLPSIRAISAETATNVNTVKKAFAELELSGVIYTVPGTGSFVSENALESSSVTAKALRELKEALVVARSVGVTESEVIELASSVYKEDI